MYQHNWNGKSHPGGESESGPVTKPLDQSVRHNQVWRGACAGNQMIWRSSTLHLWWLLCHRCWQHRRRWGGGSSSRSPPGCSPRCPQSTGKARSVLVSCETSHCQHHHHSPFLSSSLLSSYQGKSPWSPPPLLPALSPPVQDVVTFRNLDLSHLWKLIWIFPPLKANLDCRHSLAVWASPLGFVDDQSAPSCSSAGIAPWGEVKCVFWDVTKLGFASILCSLFLEVFTSDVAPTAVLKHCFIALTVAKCGRNCSEQTSMNYECQEFQVCSTLYMFVPQGLHAVKGDLDWIRNWKVNLGFSSPGSFSSVFLRTFGKNATWKVNVRLSHPMIHLVHSLPSLPK